MLILLTTIVYGVARAKLSAECLKSVGFMNGLIMKEEREKDTFVSDMSYLESHLGPEMTPARFSYSIAKIDSTSYFSLSALRLSLNAHPQVTKELE